ncbi:MAG: asparagine synthase C-terminal domain-containing protein [Terriglobia bacterium]
MPVISNLPAALNLGSLEIEGLPALNGVPLSAQDLPPVASSQLDSWIALAQRTRGQFSIIARSGDTSIAVTDLGGSYPVFQNLHRSGCDFGTSLDSVTKGERSTLSVEAASRYIAFGTVGVGLNLVEGVRALPSASITICEKGKTTSTGWFDWLGAAKPSGDSVEDLEKEFRGLIASWAAAYLPKEGKVGLLLSAGTDSGLLTALMKPILGDRLVCFTQDFFNARYSERAGAEETARRVGARIIVVPIKRRDYFNAVQKLNASSQDTAVHQAEAYNMYCLASFAKKQGIDTLITGYNADYLFLGMEHFHAGLPRDREEYRKVVSQLSAGDKASRVMGHTPVLTDFIRDILGALNIPASEFSRQVEQVRSERRRSLTDMGGKAELLTLLQLGGQIDGGLAWQDEHGCLAVMRALPGTTILCPFYDSEIISFALKLPLELLFNEGRNKFLLRKMLKDETGLERPKKPASLSPARLWRLFFNPSEYRSVSPLLRKYYLRLWLRNFLGRGRRTHELTTAAALGRWLQSHAVQLPESRSTRTPASN